METGDINNFLALVGAAELEDAKPKAAPFGMKKTETQKVIFRSCRAKNFRSIGNEFMQIDFDKAKSTLVVSEDNGSGKSTLAVWAPYYALFDKAYAPKEKKGGLINSSTRKDMLVEIRFNTKGKEYLVRRGAKPTVFEILYMGEDGSWIKIEEEAAQRDQQAFLENILGFDSKIAENVMILGADKFTPFVEMDAPGRRHVVEKIWDLAIFPVMLKISKEDLAVEERKASEVSITLDSLKVSLHNINERKQQLLSHIKTVEQLFEAANVSLGNIKEIEQYIATAPAGFDSERLTYRERIVRDKETLEKLRLEVGDKYTEKLDASRQLLTQAEAKAMMLLNSASGSVDLSPLQQAISEAETQMAAEIASIKESAAEEYNRLNTAANEAEATANEQEREIREIRSGLKAAIVEPVEMTAIKVELTSNREKMAELSNSLFDVGEKLKIEHGALNGHNSKKDSLKSSLKFLNLKREALDQKVLDFEHLGQCPTCRQAIGDEAIAEMRKGLQKEYDAIDSSEIDSELAVVEQQILVVIGEVADLSLKESNFKKEIEIAGAAIRDLESKYQSMERALELKRIEFDSQTDLLVSENRMGVVSQAKSAVKDVVNNTKVKLAECTSRWNVVIEERKTALKTSESERRANISAAQAQGERGISEAKSVIENLTASFNSEFHQASSELTASISSMGQVLANIDKQQEEALSVANAKLKSYKEQEATMRGKAEEQKASLRTMAISLEEEEVSVTGDIGKGEAALNALVERCRTYKFIINELGDKAAKADIIKAYMPFLNQKVNEYLAGMNMFLGFKIDENFEVEFTSPDRKGQTTFSLSKGQLTRVNLAVLFGLRDVANLKASVDTNLLVMDETLENLSEQGVREIVEMMSHKFNSLNTLVVSQRKTEFSEYFSNVIAYGLRGGFTTII